MSQRDPTFAALMRKLREVWAAEGEDTQGYLLRELEAMIHRYQEIHRGAD